MRSSSDASSVGFDDFFRFVERVSCGEIRSAVFTYLRLNRRSRNSLLSSDSRLHVRKYRREQFAMIREVFGYGARASSYTKSSYVSHCCNLMWAVIQQPVQFVLDQINCLVAGIRC